MSPENQKMLTIAHRLSESASHSCSLEWKNVLDMCIYKISHLFNQQDTLQMRYGPLV